jgi:hypothetical protein
MPVRCMPIRCMPMRCTPRRDICLEETHAYKRYVPAGKYMPT